MMSRFFTVGVVVLACGQNSQSFADITLVDAGKATAVIAIQADAP